jgi:hypothetical protein
MDDEKESTSFVSLQKKFQDFASENLDGKNNYIIIAFLIVAFVLFIVISWIFNTLNKREYACKKLDSIYPAINNYKSNSYLSVQGKIIKKSDYDDSNELKNIRTLFKNYTIKAAYNCCCGDGYKNNFVNNCALLKCIQQGARCLDFEIYSYNDEPIVAASTANNNSIKETYNYLKLADVFDTLKSNVFHGSTSARNDPMILHFRIMSSNKIIYDKIGKLIKDKLSGENNDNLIFTKYDKNNYKSYSINSPNYETNIDQLLTTPIEELYKKYIFAVNTKHNPILNNSSLAQFVNFRSGFGTSKFKLYYFREIESAGKNNELLINTSKSSIIMVIPNLINSIINYDYTIPLSNGCQIIAMKFQNMDNFLVSYNNYFKNNGGYSIVLKPHDKRKDRAYTPVQESGATLTFNTPINPSVGLSS